MWRSWERWIAICSVIKTLQLACNWLLEALSVCTSMDATKCNLTLNICSCTQPLRLVICLNIEGRNMIAPFFWSLFLLQTSESYCAPTALLTPVSSAAFFSRAGMLYVAQEGNNCGGLPGFEKRGATEKEGGKEKRKQTWRQSVRGRLPELREEFFRRRGVCVLWAVILYSESSAGSTPDREVIVSVG